MNHNIFDDGESVFAFGRNLSGQLGLGDNQDRNKPELLRTDPQIKRITSGRYHTITWRNNGDVLVFGSNHYRQLGLGDNQNRNKAGTINDRSRNQTNHLWWLLYHDLEKNGDVWSLVIMNRDKSG